MSVLAGIALVAALAAAPPGAVVGEGVQAVTVRIQECPASVVLEAEDGAGRLLSLEDVGGGLRAGTFRGPPARAFPLRVLEVGTDGRTELWDGLAMLADREREVVAFRMERLGEARRLVRIPAAPDAVLEVGPPERGGLALGWGGLVLAWVSVLVGVWAWVGRRGGP